MAKRYEMVGELKVGDEFIYNGIEYVVAWSGSKVEAVERTSRTGEDWIELDCEEVVEIN